MARPFLNRGVPLRFRAYDLPFLHWLAWDGGAGPLLHAERVTWLDILYAANSGTFSNIWNL